MPALFADSLTRHAVRLLRLPGTYNRRGRDVAHSLCGARPQVLGSWHSPAVLETCRGVTHTGSNRLTCPARLTLPAVADSIGFGGGPDDGPPWGVASPLALAAFQRWPIARGSSLPRRVPGSTCFQVARLFLFVFQRSAALFLGVGSAAPAGSAFPLRGVPPADIQKLGTVSGVTSGADKES